MTTPPDPVTVKPEGAYGITELSLAASAVVATATGPAVHLTMEQLYELIEGIHQVAQFHEASPPPELSGAKLAAGTPIGNEVRSRQAAEALPTEFPRGPWYAVKYGSREPLPGACACCKEQILRQSTIYYLLVDATGHWTDAALHRRCAKAIMKFRFYDFDLIHP